MGFETIHRDMLVLWGTEKACGLLLFWGKFAVVVVSVRQVLLWTRVLLTHPGGGLIQGPTHPEFWHTHRPTNAPPPPGGGGV